MKLFTIFSAAAFLLGGLVTAPAATDHISVRFATPVMIGETQIPAGDCDIQVMRSNTDSTILVVRPQKGSSVSVLANHVSESRNQVEGEASIILDRRGDNYFLNSILFADQSGYQVQATE